MDSRPDWGRGRIDPLNPFKFRQLGQKVDETHACHRLDVEHDLRDPADFGWL